MVNFADCCGVFLLVTVVKLLCALRIDLYHSTDFDVHRNWLAVTHQEPIDKWYFEQTSEWTLDYPPFFAHFEHALSKLAVLIDPLLVTISADPISTRKVVLFQKASVMVTDAVLLIGCYLFGRALDVGDKNRLLFPTLVIGNFGLFLVDHIHFQYNGMLIGFLLTFLAALLSKRYILAAVLFTTLLHFKHLFLYVAPFVGIALLQACNQLRVEHGAEKGFRLLAALGAVVIGISAISVGPFISHLPQLQARLFPFTRGLTHSYWAGNIWALYNLVDWISSRFLGVKSTLTAGLVGEFTHHTLPTITPTLCAGLTLLAMGPALFKTFTKPARETWLLSFCCCGMASFLFGWHVHEKAILLVILPLTGLLFTNESKFFRPFIILSVSGHSGLLPLVYTRFEQVIVLGVYFVYTLSLLHIHRLQFKKLLFLEKFYVLATFGIAAYVQILSHILNPNLPFLALILQSTYSAIGILYTFVVLNYHLFTLETKLKSWGLISSIQNVTTSSDRSIGSAWMEQRNHHGDGNKQIANFITAMFGEQSWMTKSDEKSFESFVYLSQIVQAVCTTSQAAFYRSRSGVNGTMGALYWQLNDVWTTVSWSSIDYSKKYKPLHYEISKVFTSPITLVTNHDVDDFLKVFVVSDADSVIWVELEIQSFLWNTLQMQDKAITTHIEVKPNGANLIQKSHVGFLLEELLCPFGQWDLCVFNLIIRPAENETRKFDAQESWFSPVPYKDITFFKQTDANVTANSCVVEDEAISIRVSTNFPQPFVWLDTTLSDGQWTQNNMMLLKEHTIVKWETRQTIKCEDFMARLRIFYPSKIFSNEKEDGKSGIGIYWWICLLLGCTFLILICQLVCCGDERGRARADSDRRPLHFGKSKPRVQKYA